MRDAELRFDTSGCGSRSERRRRPASSSTVIEVEPAPPGRRQGRHDRPGRPELEATTRSGSPTARPSGRTARPTASAPSGRSGARSSACDGSATCPARATVYGPVTALPMETVPETFVHPAGFCQNVLATGRVLGSAGPTRSPAARRSSSSATTRGRSRSPPTGRTSRSSSAWTARRGRSLRLVETIGGVVTRDRRGRPSSTPTRRCRRPRSTSRSRRGRRCIY